MNKKMVIIALALLTVFAAGTVFAQSWSAGNGTFGGVGTNVRIKFWTDGNLEVTVAGTAYPLCGRWVRRGDTITLSFNGRAPNDLKDSTFELTIIDNNTLQDGPTTYRRL